MQGDEPHECAFPVVAHHRQIIQRRWLLLAVVTAACKPEIHTYISFQRKTLGEEARLGWG